MSALRVAGLFIHCPGPVGRLMRKLKKNIFIDGICVIFGVRNKSKLSGLKSIMEMLRFTVSLFQE